ncbi:MAG: hypothetical protein ACPKOI_14440 [Pleomorphochaeta sp.]
MKIKRLILLLFMTTLATFIFASERIEVAPPGVPLEIYGIWNPNEEPLFILSANSQSIDYTQSTIQYQTADYDLSVPNQTENFNIYLYSNYNYWSYYGSTKNYTLNIYFSNYFVPVDDTLFSQNNYPSVPIYLNETLSNKTFSVSSWPWGSTTYNYIEADSNVQNQSSSITYENRTVPAKKYGYNIRIPSGLNSLDLIYFNFRWNGYTTPVNRYWDMEGYVRVEIISN